MADIAFILHNKQSGEHSGGQKLRLLPPDNAGCGFDGAPALLYIKRAFGRGAIGAAANFPA